MKGSHANQTRRRIAAAAIVILAGWAALPPSAAGRQAAQSAQGSGADQQATGGRDVAHEPVSLAATDVEIARAWAATERFLDPEEARRAGYRPRFGFSPTMGVHWVNRSLMNDGVVDIERPEVLMYMPIHGEETLVGVAYGKWQPRGAMLPEGFAGAEDVWHTHQFGLRPRSEVAMVHLWFENSPDGRFANHNPWLPFMSLGIEPPAADEFTDPGSSERLRTLAIALGETIRPLGSQTLTRWLASRAEEATLDSHRMAIRELVPALRAAAAADDAASFDLVTDQVLDHWKIIEATYLEVIPTEGGRNRMSRALAKMKGQTHHHGEAAMEQR